MSIEVDLTTALQALCPRVAPDVAELGTAPATVEQLLAFKPGDFIELDLEAMIKAKVDGVPVFDCQYGTSNGKYAIKIHEMLTGSQASWLGARNDA